MRVWAVSAAFCLAALAALPASAQRGGPAELPPPGFTGQQYVDSKGCLYVRAGFGGQTNWVARLGSNRRPLCGQPPTREAMARGAAPVVAEAPRPASAAPARSATAAASVPPPSAPPVAGCPAHAPGGQRLAGGGGGAALVCTAPGVVISGARRGDPGRGVGPGAVVSDPRMPEFTVPKGYRLAWKDDRLNPNRGRGTAEGAAAMGRIWTTDVPQGLLVDQRPEVAAERRTVTVSSKGAPAPRAVSSAVTPGRFVQVGSFGVPQNAQAAAARLVALGLPVQVARATAKGRTLDIVRAGPFGSAKDVDMALRAARGAGFVDAVVR